MDDNFLTPRQVGALHAKYDKNITLIHVNAQAARNKEEQFLALFTALGFEPDIFMVTETWYRTETDVFKPPGYKSFFVNRLMKNGGGVMLMAKQVISCHLVESRTCIMPDYEVLTVRFSDFFFCVLYRPPKGSVSNFLSFLDDYLGWVNDSRGKLVLAGDLNIDALKTSPQQQELYRILECNGFSNTITLPTRIQSNTSTLLDMFITNIDNRDLMSGVICAPISDHLPIFFTTNQYTSVAQIAPQSSRTFRDINSFNLTSFRNELLQTDWSDIWHANTAETAYEGFLNKFIIAYDKHFPYKTLKHPRKGRKPWITKTCLKEIHIKNKLYAVFISNKNDDTLREFKVQRNKVNTLLRYERRRYLHNLFDKKVMKNTDLAWKRLNVLLGRKGTEKTDIDGITIDGITITGADLTTSFNDYFTSLCDTSNHNQDYKLFLGPQTRESAFLAPTSEEEVVNVFRSLNNTNCNDVDGLQIKPVKEVIDVISPLLTFVFNLVFADGSFPKRMQEAKVTVIHKGGDKNILSNYRPISILPVFSKGLEKLIHARMTSFISKHHIITSAQFGYMKGLSTEHALLLQKEEILDSFEHEQCSLGVFVDYSKAFDRINHITLSKKLNHYGFRGVFHKLLESYLLHRKQQVRINNHVSHFSNITAGVPQGSILGPLLFCLYINDLVNIDNSTKFIIYADDTTLLFKGRDPSYLANEANRVLQRLYLWSTANSLAINTTKTKAVLFRPKNRRINTNLELKYGTSQIEIVAQIKCLGVLFEEHMTWNMHVDLIAARISRVCGVLNKLQFYLPRSIKLIIYNSLFMSHINYCHLVWATTTFTNIKKLHKIQKKGIRAITNSLQGCHTEPLFKNLNLPPIPELHKIILLKRYKVGSKHNSFFNTVSNLAKRRKARSTRTLQEWEIPRTRTNYGMQMLRFLLPKYLNSSIV